MAICRQSGLYVCAAYSILFQFDHSDWNIFPSLKVMNVYIVSHYSFGIYVSNYKVWQLSTTSWNMINWLTLFLVSSWVGHCHSMDKQIVRCNGQPISRSMSIQCTCRALLSWNHTMTVAASPISLRTQVLFAATHSLIHSFIHSLILHFLWTLSCSLYAQYVHFIILGA